MPSAASFWIIGGVYKLFFPVFLSTVILFGSRPASCCTAVVPGGLQGEQRDDYDGLYTTTTITSPSPTVWNDSEKRYEHKAGLGGDITLCAVGRLWNSPTADLSIFFAITSIKHEGLDVVQKHNASNGLMGCICLKLDKRLDEAHAYFEVNSFLYAKHQGRDIQDKEQIHISYRDEAPIHVSLMGNRGEDSEVSLQRTNNSFVDFNVSCSGYPVYSVSLQCGNVILSNDTSLKHSVRLYYANITHMEKEVESCQAVAYTGTEPRLSRKINLQLYDPSKPTEDPSKKPSAVVLASSVSFPLIVIIIGAVIVYTCYRVRSESYSTIAAGGSSPALSQSEATVTNSSMIDSGVGTAGNSPIFSATDVGTYGSAALPSHLTVTTVVKIPTAGRQPNNHNAEPNAMSYHYANILNPVSPTTHDATSVWLRSQTSSTPSVDCSLPSNFQSQGGGGFDAEDTNRDSSSATVASSPTWGTESCFTYEEPVPLSMTRRPLSRGVSSDEELPPLPHTHVEITPSSSTVSLSHEYIKLNTVAT